jgi:hypothetical protein
MADKFVIDTKNPYAAEILRDLDEAKRSSRAGHRILLIKAMLENLTSLEHKGCGLSAKAIEHLREAVFKELMIA